MRPKILAISGFAEEFRVSSLRDETGIELKESEDGRSLKEAFYHFLYSLPKQDFSYSNPYNIWTYYIQATKIMGREMTEEERKEIKTNARNEGEALFSKFLFEALNFEDQEKLNFKWNRVFNGQSSIAYHRIPIGFECSAKFKQFNLQFSPAQREGVAFMEAVGSGIVAYDVGVGKTMTAIISLAQAMFSGRASRPLIVVPNPTYGKWIKEIIGYKDERTGVFVPGVLSNTKYRLNEWYNLGTEVLSRVDLTKKIPANTITIVTYEGFTKIGFSEKAMDGIFVELTNILAQSTEGMSERDKEINYQKYREIIGTGLKGTEADIDTLGVDYMVIDEAHRCKNIFEAVKADKDGKKRFGISSGVSDTGIKAFFLCNFIQRTFGRNVMLLTATPFTNSPLEIYSMLSLVAHDGMKKMGIYTLKAFFELFVLEQTEYVVNYKEEVVPRDVIKSFNNRLLLQKLIYNHINYKTGEEAGIKRPCKINLPAHDRFAAHEPERNNGHCP
jgi:N12 class adenine-specific DNA methylase